MLIDENEDIPMARGEPRQFTMVWQELDKKHQLAWRLDGEIFWYIDLDEGLMGGVGLNLTAADTVII